MTLLSPAFLDELRTRTTLSTLVARTVKLTRAGREHKACCPFHQEKTPSFWVNDEKGFYHCFGCSAHGDAIKWLTEARGLSFIDAVKELAQAAGMAVPAGDPRAREKAERAAGLHEVVARAATWFGEQLGGIAGAEARAYLDRRGIAAKTARDFGLGFAPDGRTKLKAALGDIGEGPLTEAGLLIQVEGKDRYDRFRGRLMIPIRDPRGRVIAFGGRIIGDGEPKYLNSPETPLFDKGRTLYNLDRAGAAARAAGRILVVEGYLDVIALAQAGIAEAVAPLGTALTEEQMALLWKQADVPVLCFDGDAAGRKAAVRAALRAMPLIEPGRSLAFALLPEGVDPDDMIRAGGARAFEKLVAAATPLDELIWRHELAEAGPLDTPEQRANLGRKLRDHCREIRDDFLRRQYLGALNERLYALLDRRREALRPRWTPGIRRRPVPPADALPAARRIGDAGIDRAAVGPAILHGLARHPELIAAHAETLSRLMFHDRAQALVQEVLLRAALTEPRLDTGRVATILDEEGLGAFLATAAGANHIAFSFLSGKADPADARRDLASVIDLLVAVHEVRRELGRATARLVAGGGDDAYAEQQRLREAERNMQSAFADLANGAEVAF